MIECNAGEASLFAGIVLSVQAKMLKYLLLQE